LRDWNCGLIEAHNETLKKHCAGEYLYLLVGQQGLEPRTGWLWVR